MFYVGLLDGLLGVAGMIMKLVMKWSIPVNNEAFPIWSIILASDEMEHSLVIDGLLGYWSVPENSLRLAPVSNDEKNDLRFQAAVGAFEAIDRHRQALEPENDTVEPEAA